MIQPSDKEKNHMIELVEEFKDIVAALPKTRDRPMQERLAVRNRLAEIRSEMNAYLRKYPND